MHVKSLVSTHTRSALSLLVPQVGNWFNLQHSLVHVESLVSTHTRIAMSGGSGDGAACDCDNTEQVQ